MGGRGEDRTVGVSLAPDGSTYIFGDTGSSDFRPMAGGVLLPSRLLGPPDLFVLRLDWAGRPTDMLTLGSWREVIYIQKTA